MKDITQIKRIGIAGAGTMGYSMAEIFAAFGYEVLLFDISAEQINKAQDFIRINREVEVEQNRLTAEESAELVQKIKFTTEMELLAHVDFIVEAIVENIDIKLSFWSQLSRIVPEDIVLVSNTSGLSITKLATAVEKPERFLGMHWINPPHIIRLIEVIKGEKTSDENAKIVIDLAESVEKKAVAVNDAPGFVLNRIQFAVMREALHILEAGIADEAGIDAVMKYGLGIRYASLGPFEVADFGGLDIFHNISEYLFADLSNAERDFGKMKELFEAGHLGVKTGKGFYDYSDGKVEEVIRQRNINYERVAEALYDRLDQSEKMNEGSE